MEERALPLDLGGSPLAHGLESLENLEIPGSEADFLLGQKSERLQEAERHLSAEIELGIRAVTLYSELEWKNGLDSATASAAEEVVGEDVLFTLLIRGEDYDRAREALLPEFPGIRLSLRKGGRRRHSALG